MRRIIAIAFIFFFVSVVFGQKQHEQLPLIAKSEVRQLKQVADSLMRELKKLYRKELNEKEVNKYQPERIALVRSYILLFNHFEKKCEVAAIGKREVVQIFGKPDTVIAGNEPGTFELQYSKLIRPYVRIVNIRYHFFFRNKELYMVKRE